MKVLVTGGAGFIGSHIAQALVDRGDEVIIVDNLITGKEENLPQGARFYRADYGNISAMDRLFRKEQPEAIFHLAAHISVRDSLRHPIFYVETNVIGSMHFINIAKKYGVKKFIFASTGGVMYGAPDTFPISETTLPDPDSPYAMGKLFIEQFLFSSGIPAVALRFANVYGPRQNASGEAGVIAIFSEKMLRGDQPIINNAGKTTRDYIFVSDVVAANITALENSQALGVYNIGTGKETSTNEIFSLLNTHFNSSFEPTYATAFVSELGRSALSSEKFQKVSGWVPKVSLEEGISQTVEWFRNQHEQSQ